MMLNDRQRKAMFAKIKRCEYNSQCEDYAKDGTWKSWAYNVEKPAPAKHNIKFYSKEQGKDTIHEYDVCDGCLAGLTPIDNDDDVQIVSVNRIAPPTESYDGKRGDKYSQVHKLKTKKMIDEAIANLHRYSNRYSKLTDEQRQEEYIKKVVPKLRKSNMKSYGRYIIDENGNYIGDKELESIHNKGTS